MSLIGQIRLALPPNVDYVTAAIPYIDMDDHPEMCYETGYYIGWGQSYYADDMGVSSGEITPEQSCNYFFPGTTPTILEPDDDGNHPCSYSIYHVYDCVGDEEEESEPTEEPEPENIRNLEATDPQRAYFNYTQKMSQAFILFDSNEVPILQRGDLFLAHCHEDRYNRPSYVGAVRYIAEDFITVPVMGSDSSSTLFLSQ